MEVTIDGVVPQAQAYQVMVLLIKEIDNSGSVVPGSTILISQPVAGQPATTTQTVLPTPAHTIILPSPTKSAGFTVTTGIFAIGLLSLLLFRRGK